MIVRSYIVKIIDFGMAKAVSNIYSPQLDSSQSVVGTIPYMAPELIKFDVYDGRVDLWSLGVLVFEMATGEPFVKGSGAPL
jgi:serine/threonine protein kinase